MSRATRAALKPCSLTQPRSRYFGEVDGQNFGANIPELGLGNRAKLHL
jgi:hypothetical protein